MDIVSDPVVELWLHTVVDTMIDSMIYTDIDDMTDVCYWNYDWNC